MIIGITLVLLIIYMVFTAHNDTIDYRTINDQQLPSSFNGLKIFFIADIHRRSVSENTLMSIKEKIDIVVIGGDLTEKGVPLKRTRSNLRKLKKLDAPVYFVWGNNDYEIQSDKLTTLLINESIIILKDSYVNITRNDDMISLIGFDYIGENEERIKIDWQDVKGNYCILLTHISSALYELEPNIQKNIRIVLAGHTHGGQIRFFGLGFYQKGGFHTHQNTKVFISEGYGYTMLPFRLQTKAECHVLTINNI